MTDAQRQREQRQNLRQHWLDTAENRLATTQQHKLAGDRAAALRSFRAAQRALACARRYAPKAGA